MASTNDNNSDALLAFLLGHSDGSDLDDGSDDEPRPCSFVATRKAALALDVDATARIVFTRKRTMSGAPRDAWLCEAQVPTGRKNETRPVVIGDADTLADCVEGVDALGFCGRKVRFVRDGRTVKLSDYNG